MANVALPLTYPDLVCVADLDPFGQETTSDLQSLIQDIFHVLKELPGSNPDDPDRGVGVDMYLNGTVDNFKKMAGTIENQLALDDRIDSATCATTQNPDGTYLIKIQINVAGAVIPLEYGWQDGNFTNLTGGAQ